jgi:hypothetical protein
MPITLHESGVVGIGLGGHGTVVAVVDVEELIDVVDVIDDVVVVLGGFVDDVVVVLGGFVDDVVVGLGGFGWGQRSTVKVTGGVVMPMMPRRRRSVRSVRAQSLARREGGTPSAASGASEQTVRARLQAIGSTRRSTFESWSVRPPTKPPIGDDADKPTCA